MSQPTSISGADTQAQSSPEPISLGSPISIQAASSMGDWDTASISQLLEEPMDLDFGMDQALSANSVLSSNISFHDTSNTPTTPETSVQANSQLPTGTIHSIHASSETLLDNAINQYKQQLDELIKTFTRAMAAGNRNHLKRLFSEIHQTKHLLKSFRKLKEEEYGNPEPKNKPTTTQAKLSVRDIPPFQLKGSHVWRPDKEVFESAVHFLSSFQKVLNTGSVNKDLEWQKWLHVALHQDHDEWFESELADKGYTWEQAKVVFKKRFQSMDYIVSKTTQAYSITMNSDESILDFATRFQACYRQGGLKDGEGLALRFMAALLPQVRDRVKLAWHAKHNGHPQRVDDIIQVAQTITEDKRVMDTYQPRNNSHRRHGNKRFRRHSPYAGSRNMPKRSGGSSHAAVGCDYHGPKAHHSSQECFKLNKNRNSKCDYCGKERLPGHRCDEYRQAMASRHKQNNTNGTSTTHTVRAIDRDDHTPSQSQNDYPTNDDMYYGGNLLRIGRNQPT